MLTRKMLSAMGIEADKIDEIVKGNSESLAALSEQLDTVKAEAAKYKAEAEKYKAEAEKLPKLQEELKAMKDKAAADAKEREGKDYDALKKEYDDYKAEQEKKAVRSAKEAAYREILKDAGIPEKHFAKILRYSDVDGVELDEKGKITTAKEILKSIKDEWSDHIQKADTQGAATATPPATSRKGMTREEIDKIEDTDARQKAMLENLDLYGL